LVAKIGRALQCPHVTPRSAVSKIRELNSGPRYPACAIHPSDAGPRTSSFSSDDAQYPPESVLCVHLQRRRDSNSSRHTLSDIRIAAFADHCRSRHGAFFLERCQQCLAAADDPYLGAQHDFEMRGIPGFGDRAFCTRRTTRCRKQSPRRPCDPDQSRSGPIDRARRRRNHLRILRPVRLRLRPVIDSHRSAR